MTDKIKKEFFEGIFADILEMSPEVHASMKYDGDGEWTRRLQDCFLTEEQEKKLAKLYPSEDTMDPANQGELLPLKPEYRICDYFKIREVDIPGLVKRASVVRDAMLVMILENFLAENHRGEEWGFPKDYKAWRGNTENANAAIGDFMKHEFGQLKPSQKNALEFARAIHGEAFDNVAKDILKFAKGLIGSYYLAGDFSNAMAGFANLRILEAWERQDSVVGDYLRKCKGMLSKEIPAYHLYKYEGRGALEYYKTEEWFKEAMTVIREMEDDGDPKNAVRTILADETLVHYERNFRGPYLTFFV